MKANSLLIFLLFSLLIPSFTPTAGSDQKAKTGDRDNALQEAIKKLANDRSLEKGRLSFLALDLESGTEQGAHRPKEGVLPASTQKLVTTISALRILGPDHRFRTFLGYRGRIENKTLKGDLVIKGGGDPAFLSKEFREHYGTRDMLFDKWANSCEEAGIEKVEGKLLVDASYFPYNTLSRGRIWEDMGNYFGAFPTGMNVMDNAFELRFRTPDRIGAKTRITDRTPKTPWLKFENRVKSSELQKDEAYIFGKPYDTQRVVEGTLPAGKQGYFIEGAMPDPARTTAWMVHEHFEKKGVAIENGYSTYHREGIQNGTLDHILDTVRSIRTRKIVKKTNFESKNLFAEGLFLEIAKAFGTKAKPLPAGEALLERIEQWGIDTKGIRLADGSGLAPTNRLSVTFLVALLEKAWKGEHRRTIRKSLPVAGKTGTMSYIGEGTVAEGRVWAKSGYMGGVLGYAGYARDKNDEWKTFALIANNFTCSPSAMRKKMEPVLVNLVK